MTDATSSAVRARRTLLGCVLALTCFLGLRGIGDESSVMLGGDMARYVMNGVFMHDLIADGGVRSYSDLAAYAERYYAKYPALSLGHHPPLPSVSTLPFFWLFGVSLFAARMAAVCWFVLAAWGMYALATRLFDWQSGLWATSFFITIVVVLRAGQYLESEMPMTALVLWSTHALLRFCDTRRARHAVIFTVLMVASMLGKQLAVLMIPVYATVVVMKVGMRTLLKKNALIGMSVALVLLIPIAVLTIVWSPGNWNLLKWSLQWLFAGHREFFSLRSLEAILTTHLSVPLQILTIAGAVILAARRRQQFIIIAVWLVVTIGTVVVLMGGVEPARYAFGALAAYCLLIAGIWHVGRDRPGTRLAAAVVLFAALGWQVWVARNVYPSGVGGYETAAQYVLQQDGRPVVLYDSAWDTGYFPFFVRKLDPKREHAVFRADKLLPQAALHDADDIRRELYHQLDELGVRWIVAEERRTGPLTLRTLHEELQHGRFALRKEIPVISTAVSGLHLLVYEYLEPHTPNYDAEVNIDLRLSSRSIRLRLRDVVPTR